MFAYLHQRIRNDEHCPLCRQYFLKIFNDENSVTNTTKYNTIDNDNYFYTEWQDEWVRRRNGDQYTLQPITLNKIYDLNNFENECDFNRHTPFNLKIHKKANYLKIKIIIDKTEYCPNNILYFLTFFENNDEIEYSQKWTNTKNGGIFKKFIKIEYNEDGYMQININDLCEYVSPEKFFNL